MSVLTRRIILTILFCIITLNISANVGNKVLVINSYSSDYQWSNVIVDEINTALKRNFSNMELNIEYLSSERFIDPRIWVDRINLLLSNYTDEMPIGIIIISDEAWMSYRAADTERFRNVPLLLCAVKPHSVTVEKYIQLHDSLTLADFTSTEIEMQKYGAVGVIREMNIAGYVSLMNALIPNIDRYALITDSRFYGVYIKLLFEEYCKSINSSFPIDYLDARFITTDTLLHKLRDISPSTGLLLTSWLTGQAGYEYSKQYIYKEMSQLLKTPIFITNDIGISTDNFLGGYYYESQIWGEKIGNKLLKVLHGINYSNIKTETYKAAKCQINWKVLNRFNIRVENLPEDTTFIINRPESVFIKYSNQFIIGSAVFVLILLGCTYVIKSNIKLKRAKKVAQRAIIEAYDANQHLIETQDNLKVALVKAEAADRLKTSFINNMDHEIRTPLNSIVGFSSLISSMEDKEDIEEAASQISKNSDKLLQIIKSMMDLSQLESGTATFDFAKIDLDGIFIDLVTKNYKKCNPGVELIFNQLEKPLSIITEQNKVLQILSNLIHNAIKFTNQGTIEIGYLDYDEHWVELYVKDTGVGMSQEDIDRIFERFYKSNSDILGAGLGLSLAKKIVEALDGQYGVNTELGVGSRFWFRLKKV